MYNIPVAIVETLTLTVGVSISKWILGAWLGDGLAKELGSEFTDLAAQKIPSLLERRRVLRQVDQIADLSADKLARFIEIEFRGLASNEQEAAVIEASHALDNGLGRIDLFAIDFEPIRLFELVKQANSTHVAGSGLSEKAEQVYDAILRESTNYVTEVATTMPAFGEEASKELLRRDTQIIGLVGQVLEKLVSPNTVDLDGPRKIAEFETTYRRFVAGKYDYLQLFGLTVSKLSARYALSVAYITLAVKGTTAPSRPTPTILEVDGKGSLGSSQQDEYLRADEALAASSRVLIRGEAGSGKTTLMQWLAVQSVRRDFTGALSDWNETIPIFLQLRRFDRGDYPAPSAFLTNTSKSIAESVPEGWVRRHLSSGNAILLIDGVDEVEESAREGVRQWIVDLTLEFPDCKYVVTSRPAAVSEDWLKDEDFYSVEMQPMGTSDIRSFIDHWHTAAARDITDDEDVSELQRFRIALLDSISLSPQVRNLATTPLLCAMLCALNRDRRTQLPKDRLELYRIALETILDRRDMERDVKAQELSHLTLPQKSILLRELAYWLMLNERSDLDVQTAIDRFDYRIQFMPGMDGVRGADLLKFLLVRSGILREPVPGRVDFIHRSFQEYLAAIEVVAQGNIPFLLTKADQDQWREVIILAAGHCPEKAKEDLLEGLITRGEKEPSSRHRLHLLAVACLETAREISPALASRIVATLDELLPPSNMTEAKALASAGELALLQLLGVGRVRGTEACACIRTASLVGGDGALEVMQKYAGDTRVLVQRELVRAWSRADDPGVFARSVLKNAELEGGYLLLSDPAVLPYVHELEKLLYLKVEMRNTLVNIGVLPSISQLRTLDFRFNRRLIDIGFLSNCKGLTSLDLEGCAEIADIGPLSTLPLSWLDLSGTSVTDLSPIEAAPIKILLLNKIPTNLNLSAVGSIRTLEYLSVSGNENSNFRFVEQLTELATLLLADCVNMDSLNLVSLSKLEVLHVVNARSLGRVEGLSGSLKQLTISNASPQLKLEGTLEFPELTRLNLNGCVGITDLSFINGCSNLRTVTLSGLSKVSDFSFLSSLSKVSTLNLAGTAIDDLSQIHPSAPLTTLTLTGAGNFSSLKPLTRHKRLRRLSIFNPHGPLDLRELIVPGGQARNLFLQLTDTSNVSGIDEFKKAGGTLRIFRTARAVA